MVRANGSCGIEGNSGLNCCRHTDCPNPHCCEHEGGYMGKPCSNPKCTKAKPRADGKCGTARSVGSCKHDDCKGMGCCQHQQRYKPVEQMQEAKPVPGAIYVEANTAADLTIQFLYTEYEPTPEAPIAKYSLCIVPLGITSYGDTKRAALERGLQIWQEVIKVHAEHGGLEGFLNRSIST